MLCITGPRQAGKTTLVRTAYPNKPYLSLEDPDMARLAWEDPRGFLDTYQNGDIYFWRDNGGTEIDIIFEEGLKRRAIEVKSSKTFTPEHTSGLKVWIRYSGASVDECSIVYTGDRALQWRGDHVSVKQLAEDFACYLYLPRLLSPTTLTRSINDGLSLLTWQQDSFAWADEYDSVAQRYRGLCYGINSTPPDPDSTGLLVKPEVALRQLEQESRPVRQGSGSQMVELPSGTTRLPDPPTTPVRPQLKRYHGTVVLDTERVNRDAGRIAEEIISHLAVQPGARLTVTLEIEAELPTGAREDLVRIVTENAKTLGFTSQGFERE